MTSRFDIALHQLQRAQQINRRRHQATAYMRRWRANKQAQRPAPQRKETDR